LAAPSKSVADSQIVASQLMQPVHTNFAGFVHGGNILKMADDIAYACASKHAGMHCVTVSVDQVSFHSPIKVGQLVTFKASVNYVGRTSIEVGIKIVAEDLLTGKTTHTNSCYFTMVAMDGSGRPRPAPSLVPKKADEKRRHEAAKERRRHRQARG